jgi:3-oxoadipate enol-lactonase
MPYASVNGTKLYYESHGTGQPIVCVHGAGGNHASWFNQVAAFAGTHRVVTYDQRGFGNSEDPDRRGRSAMADDLAGLLDHLEIARAVLLAQSLGGGAATGYTCRHPARVAGLVLADTFIGIRQPPEIAAIMTEVTARTTGLPQIIRVLGAKTRERHPELALLYAGLASFNTYTLGNLPGEFTPVEPDALAATGVPILFIVGSDDILIPPDCLRRMHEAIARSQFIEIAGVGHSAYFEDPGTFNRHLHAFLAGLG